MRTDLRSPKLTKAIRHAIDEARLAYEFVPNSHTAWAFNACLAVEQAYREATGRVSTITTPLAGSGRTSCMPMEFIEASSDRARVHHDTNTTTKPNQREGATNDQ